MRGFTKSHPNRKFHNWLIYDVYESFLLRCVTDGFFSGVIYDLGAGELPYKSFVSDLVSQYVSVDWAESLHDLKADIFADLNQPFPIDSAVADTVLSLSVMEHLHEPQRFLNEAYRILKVGGVMILHVPFMWWVHEAPYDYFRYTPYGLMRLFEEAGFVDVIVNPEAGFFSMITLKMNYFSLRFIRGPRPLRFLIKAGLIPFWYLGQVCAPYLDKLDRNWTLETTGYYVTARKA